MNNNPEQVFMRRDNKLFKQSAPSVGTVAQRVDVIPSIQRFAGLKFRKEFTHIMVRKLKQSRSKI